MSFNENTRVKIPAILHLCKLGYDYLSLKTAVYNLENNIFESIFRKSLKHLNPNCSEDKLFRYYQKLVLALGNEDLGQEFYNLLIYSDIKAIDFENFGNNVLNVVTELPCKNGEEEFRPDITILINGLPLAFVEVKKPNNKDGILAERDRIDKRFQNKKFRKFINISQILVFSNNMEYDDSQLQGAFYTSTSYNKAIFNTFKEEILAENQILNSLNDGLENQILIDNNLQEIKYSPEFLENKSISTPTNKILTSIFAPQRLGMWLKYGLTYLKNDKGQIQKHIMRYPQFFATKAIENNLQKDIKRGIIWHTQGSGKTALAFYSVRYLADFYQKQKTIPKFYFIVDRIDLLEQAKKEFISRGLTVHTINSKEQFLSDFKANKIIHNTQGKLEITVVNIQKFQDEIIELESSCNLNMQRIYFLDEVHRSYSPTGSFLANLTISDRNAVMIGLTGTPLIGDKLKSKDIFGDYIHKYYYNASIADGYTLRLIREGIETDYKIQMQQVLEQIQVAKNGVKESEVQAHPKFVEPMLDYILNDLKNSKIRLGDSSIGAMVVCNSSDQAKEMYRQFQKNHSQNFRASLILHDIGNKQSRNDEVAEFKSGNIDILFVFNMLLTGFDAPRLKKLYLARKIAKHNLLQTLTRVNRTYKDFRFGYVVDFADIRAEFDATNKAYFEELQSELGDELQNYSDIFLSKEEVEIEIENIKDKLFEFDLHNAENFSKQINQINNKKQILDIKKALQSSRDMFNMIKYLGHFDLLQHLDFRKLQQLYTEASNRLDWLNLQESLADGQENSNLLNLALEEIVFKFVKVSEEEMKIADELKNTLQQARESLLSNFDPKDPEYVSLYEEFKRLFGQKNFGNTDQEIMSGNIITIRRIYEQITDLNRRNNLLKEKYEGDEKFVRIHKKVRIQPNLNAREIAIFKALIEVKHQADKKVLDNQNVLENENYFNRHITPAVVDSFRIQKIQLDAQATKTISGYIATEYINNF